MTNLMPENILRKRNPAGLRMEKFFSKSKSCASICSFSAILKYLETSNRQVGSVFHSNSTCPSEPANSLQEINPNQLREILRVGRRTLELYGGDSIAQGLLKQRRRTTDKCGPGEPPAPAAKAHSSTYRAATANYSTRRPTSPACT